MTDEIQSFLSNKITLRLQYIDMKIVILALLILFAAGQIVNLSAEAITTTPDPTVTVSPPENKSSQYVNIPLDQLDDVDLFLLDQIRSLYPYLNDFKLSEVNLRISPDGTQTQIAFTYEQSSQNTTVNSSEIINQTVVLVLGTDNLTYFALYDGQTINYVNYTEYLMDHSLQSPILGGFKSIDITSLDADQIEAQNYLLDNMPDLKKKKLLSLEVQVVAGLNYCFVYQDVQTNNKEKYCVWSQPWNNNLIDTNSSNITNQSEINNAKFQITIVDTHPSIDTSNTEQNTSIPLPPPLPPVGMSTNSHPIAGGPTSSEVNNLNSDQSNAKKFVLDNVAKLSTWELISLQTQVVSGMKYCFTFKDPQTNQNEQYCVWSQPWNNNFMQLTLPDNTKITNTNVSISSFETSAPIVTSNGNA